MRLHNALVYTRFMCCPVQTTDIALHISAPNRSRLHALRRRLLLPSATLVYLSPQKHRPPSHPLKIASPKKQTADIAQISAVLYLCRNSPLLSPAPDPAVNKSEQEKRPANASHTPRNGHLKQRSRLIP